MELNGAKILYTIHTDIPLLGDFKITQTLVSTWIVMALLSGFAIWLGRNLKLENVSKRQAAAEFIVERLDQFVHDNMGHHFDQYIPLIGAIFALSIGCNLISVIGLWSPTADLNTEAAWAIVVFVLIMYYKQLSEAKKYADEGYSWQTRLWVDDMFMITDLQAQAYLVTGDKKYIDRAAREMALYLDRIQRPNGLFYHHTGTPFFWGRGDGWMAVGMAEMLRMLPKDNPYLPRIKAAYLQMMETLLRYQAYDGMWRQIIDDPNSWKETSSTAMFTYAMILGVKNGWLDRKIYGTAARKAWITLLSYLDEKDNLRNVCEGTGARNSAEWYQNRRRLTGDMHGQAAMLWCAYALSCDVKPYKLAPNR